MQSINTIYLKNLKESYRNRGGKNMLFTVIKKNSYQDSVNLMLLTKSLSSMEGISQISVMMGTPANKDIFKNSGLYTEELEDACPNDICIVVDTEDKSKINEVMMEIEDFIKNQSSKSKGSKIPSARTFDTAISKVNDANLALISIAGEYATDEVERALDRNLNVFLFSDNVNIEDEKRLKEKADEKGLILMGPDCGTSILGGVPLAFANVIEKGNIGVVGASGTGIQEITTIISRYKKGITHAIGTGGRDLSSQVGAITAIRALRALAKDEETDVIVFVSKPPSPEIMDKVIKVFTELEKPVVAIFLGEKPRKNHDNVHYAWTLDEAALKAVELSNMNTISYKKIESTIPEVKTIKENKNKRFIKGLYCGGTLALEAAMIIRDYLKIEDDKNHDNGIMLHYENHEIIDLGDDKYTKGRPHPMIEPSLRVDELKKVIEMKETAIILMDNVIGYGGHNDVASVFAPVIKEAREKAKKNGNEIIFIGSVTGTSNDPKTYEDQVEILRESGAIICESNALAVKLAIKIIDYLNCEKTVEEEKKEINDRVIKLISDKPKVINIGLKHFAETVKKYESDVVQYNWSPIAGGDKRLAKILEKLK